MKRYEVTRHQMGGDFSRNHPVYWFLSGVASKRVNACVGLYGGQCQVTSYNLFSAHPL